MSYVEHREDGNNGTVLAFEDGVAVGAAWGPSADGEGAWFVRLAGEHSARRVPSRADAIALLPVPTDGGAS